MIDSSGKIYWLVSYPKSGNTWCRAFLLNYMNRDDHVYTINELHHIPMISDLNMVDHYLPVEISILTNDEIKQIRYEALLAYIQAGNPYRFIKVHDIFDQNQKFNLFNEETTAGIIYIVRNPLDVVPSLASHMSISIQDAISALNDSSFCLNGQYDKFELSFKQSLGTWSEHVFSWLNQNICDVCLIKYEDLLLDPVATFEKMVRYSGLEYDENALIRAIELSQFDNLKKQENQDGFSEKFAKSKVFFRRGKSGDWENYLNQENILSVVEKHKKVMEHIGYKIDFNL